MREWEDRVGDDGMQEPVEPFRTPGWFIILILLAAIGAVVLGLTALL